MVNKKVGVDRLRIPHGPGVYIFRSLAGEVLYVGKAINLFRRVSSYFKKNLENPRTVALVRQVSSCETIEVLSEIEALILEASLIKKYLPPFNIRLADDKDYLYIKVTDELFPKIVTARKTELSDAKNFFGPFPSSRTVNLTLKKLRRVFPWCSQGEKQHPCFYYHLHLCPGPCAGKIGRKEYSKIIHNFVQFMDGKRDELVNSLSAEMKLAADNLNFEKAESIKKTLCGVEYLTKSTSAKVYLENPNFVEDLNRHSLQFLQSDLALSEIPERIECFDISDLGGKMAVGSLVVLTSGEVDRKWYRRFKIRLEGKPNDVGMLKEVLERRVKHQEWPRPHLILIDGGKGQVKMASLVVLNQGWNVPVFGLAKRLEWLHTPEQKVIKLPRSSLSLRILQKIRDEAHRFAITYHRKLRNQRLLPRGVWGYNK